MMNNENREHCKHIAEELERYYNGVYICPECGEHCENFVLEYDENGNEVYKMDCGCVVDDEPEQLGLYDFFNDALDIQYRVGSDKQYRSVEIMVTYGGPNIYIDTAAKMVKLYWWNEYADYPIDYEVCNEIDALFEELYNC